MQKIATVRGRSPATVNNQIRENNERVRKMGYCPRCKRARGHHVRGSVGWKIRLRRRPRRR
ncbi:MAG: hypothetical protein NWE79_01085 [Candidatus Bathyarchaeota archaeon]|nr:hypothetical protein [Candidatus Bathyarchaeota archaeon]